MPVPYPPQFMFAVLCVLNKNPSGMPRKEIHLPVADLMSLTDENRSERIPSGNLKYVHRIGWSLNILKNAGCVESPARGNWRITTKGSQLIAQYPDGFSEATIEKLAQEAEGVYRHENVAASQASVTSSQTPEEQIYSAIAQIRDAVRKELLDRILKASPDFFEGLVLRLLHAMGYGSSEDDLEKVGGPGDGGIDGIISLDKLGLEKIYIQAKRWQGSVGRPAVQSFVGALGQQAKKGVFITTSTFTQDAKEYGERNADKLVLIDGAKLSALLVEFAVAVTHHETIHLPKIDEDFFDESQ